MLRETSDATDEVLRFGERSRADCNNLDSSLSISGACYEVQLREGTHLNSHLTHSMLDIRDITSLRIDQKVLDENPVSDLQHEQVLTADPRR